MPNPYYRPNHCYKTQLQHWASLSFADYARAHRGLITTLRSQHQMLASAQSVDFNAPYCLQPDHASHEHAAILIHGFIASPYYLHAIAKLYAKLGITVYNLTLPGHGTCPGDLLNCRAQTWVDYAKLIFNKVNAQHRYVHLCGHSMGAVIANLLAKEHPAQSLVELVPAHGIHYSGSWQVKVSYLLTHGLQWQLWQKRRPEVNQAAYRSAPVRACQQAARLIRQLPSPPHCPILAVASAEDATIAASKTYQRYQNLDHATLYWYQRNPDIETSQHLKVVDSSLLASDIAELSHLGVTLPETDAYFGRQGSYHRQNSALWGEYGGKFATRPEFKRLTFNPDFNNMATALTQFISNNI